jgi:hypothetical protein
MTPVTGSVPEAISPTTSPVPGLPETDRAPLFVVGMWRSGTSLLYRLINQHPEIALMYEGDLAVLRPLFTWPNRKKNWMEYWDFWSGALRRHSIDRATIPSYFPDLKTAIETVHRTYAGSKIWGCKSPNYYDRMAVLHEMFPNARFIVIWRDPADVCRSVLRAGKISYSWFNRRGMFHRGLFGCRVLKAESERLKRAGAQIHEVQYENLVSDPRKAMMEICEFLNLPYDERMTTLKGSDHSAIDPAGQHTKVKSDRIIKHSDEEEILTEEQKRKIASYVRLWQEQCDGWPRVHEVLNHDSSKPSLGQQLVDWSIYRGWRFSDRFRKWIYCLAPLWLLNSYRVVARKPALLLRQKEASEQESKAPSAVQ